MVWVSGQGCQAPFGVQGGWGWVKVWVWVRVLVGLGASVGGFWCECGWVWVRVWVREAWCDGGLRGPRK